MGKHIANKETSSVISRGAVNAVKTLFIEFAIFPLLIPSLTFKYSS